MSQEVDIYTETMAKVYADQGHWAKVVEIYRHLLASEPERLDFAEVHGVLMLCDQSAA